MLLLASPKLPLNPQTITLPKLITRDHSLSRIRCVSILEGAFWIYEIERKEKQADSTQRTRGPRRILPTDKAE